MPRRRRGKDPARPPPYLLTYLLSHSRGTPLSHPHCPVGGAPTLAWWGPSTSGTQRAASRGGGGTAREARLMDILMSRHKAANASSPGTPIAHETARACGRVLEIASQGTLAYLFRLIPSRKSGHPFAYFLKRNRHLKTGPRVTNGRTIDSHPCHNPAYSPLAPHHWSSLAADPLGVRTHTPRGESRGVHLFGLRFARALLIAPNQCPHMKRQQASAEEDDDPFNLGVVDAEDDDEADEEEELGEEEAEEEEDDGGEEDEEDGGRRLERRRRRRTEARTMLTATMRSSGIERMARRTRTTTRTVPATRGGRGGGRGGRGGGERRRRRRRAGRSRAAARRSTEQRAPQGRTAKAAPAKAAPSKASAAAAAAGSSSAAGRGGSSGVRPGRAARRPPVGPGRARRGLAQRAQRAATRRRRSGEESDSEDEPVNTIGNVPLHWYDDFDHVGYDIDGRKILRGTQKASSTRWSPASTTRARRRLREASNPRHTRGRSASGARRAWCLPHPCGCRVGAEPHDPRRAARRRRGAE